MSELPTTERRALHTPGPWCVEDPFDHELVIVQAGRAAHEWQFIATIPHGDKDEDDDEIPDVIAERNARLIAAAPDLLEALKDVLACIGTDGPLPEQYELALDAIAKAEGRS